MASCKHDFRPFNDRAIYCYRCGEFRETPMFARPVYPQPVYVPYVPPAYVPPVYPTWRPYEPTWWMGTTTTDSTITVTDVNANSTLTVPIAQA